MTLELSGEALCEYSVNSAEGSTFNLWFPPLLKDYINANYPEYEIETNDKLLKVVKKSEPNLREDVSSIDTIHDKRLKTLPHVIDELANEENEDRLIALTIVAVHLLEVSNEVRMEPTERYQLIGDIYDRNALTSDGSYNEDKENNIAKEYAELINGNWNLKILLKSR